MRRYVSKVFFYYYFCLYHYKIHPVNNYKAIKNKIKLNKTTQDKKKILTNETATTTTTTTKIKIKKMEKKTRLNYSLPPPSLFILNGVSINYMINGMPFL